MKINLSALGIASLVALLIFWGGCHTERTRWQSRLDTVQDSLRASETLVHRLRQDSAVDATQYRVDTVTVTKLVTRWQAQDTAWLASLPDTVRVPVERVIYLADSTIGACMASWRGCDRLRLNAEDRAAEAFKQVDALTRRLAQPPPLWKRPGFTVPTTILLTIAGISLLK